MREIKRKSLSAQQCVIKKQKKKRICCVKFNLKIYLEQNYSCEV